MGAQAKVEGVVMRRRPLGEADDIVTFLSPTRGRFDAVARGVRKSRKATAGRLEPFTHVRLLLAAGRGLDVVGQVEVMRARTGLVNDLDRIARAFCVLELYDHIGEASAGERLFRTLLRALDELETADPDLASRRAELRLLTVLGCAPHLETCVQCQAATDLSSFSPQSGGVLCSACATQHSRVRRLSPGGRALLLSLRSPGIDEATRWWSEFTPGMRLEVEGLLASHLDWHWPQRVRSRGFLDDLRAAAVTPGAQSRPTSPAPEHAASGGTVRPGDTP